MASTMIDREALMDAAITAQYGEYWDLIGPIRQNYIRAAISNILDVIEPVIREDEKAKADLAISFWEETLIGQRKRIARALEVYEFIDGDRAAQIARNGGIDE